METAKVTITLPIKLLEKLKQMAEKEQRSLSNMIAVLLDRRKED
jgi:predicted CopG family antitoxin